MAIVDVSVRVEGLSGLGYLAGEAARKAEHAMASQAMKDTSPYVPFQTGSLDQRTRVEDNKIIYPGPYAKFLYYGKLMVDPATGSSWARANATKIVTDRNLVFSKAAHPMAQSHWFEASKAENFDKWLAVAEKAVKHEFK